MNATTKRTDPRTYATIATPVATPPDDLVMQLAVLAPAAPTTVRKYLKGGRVLPVVARRIEAAQRLLAEGAAE